MEGILTKRTILVPMGLPRRMPTRILTRTTSTRATPNRRATHQSQTYQDHQTTTLTRLWDISGTRTEAPPPDTIATTRLKTTTNQRTLTCHRFREIPPPPVAARQRSGESGQTAPWPAEMELGPASGTTRSRTRRHVPR